MQCVYPESQVKNSFKEEEIWSNADERLAERRTAGFDNLEVTGNLNRGNFSGVVQMKA